MVRIAPTDSGASEEELRDASGLDNDDTGEDGTSSSDENNTVRANMAELRVAAADSEQYKNETKARAGESIEFLQSTKDDGDQHTVVANEATQQGTKTGIIGTPEGGTVANVRDGEIQDIVNAGDRLKSIGDSSPSDDSDPDGSDPEPTSEPSNNGPRATEVPEPIRNALRGGSGPLGQPGSGGGILDMLTSPVGIVLIVVTAVALTFGVSNDDDDGGEN